MKKLAALFVALQLLFTPVVAGAQVHSGARVVSTETWVEQWDPASRQWVRVVDDGGSVHSVTTITKRTYAGRAISERQDSSAIAFAANATPSYSHTTLRPRTGQAIAKYGPFEVVDRVRARLVGSTGRSSPRLFDAMIRDFPALEVLEFVEAPGTSDDVANLAVGRAIRAARLRTHVPEGGSVRSGAVELFLAGQRQTMDPGAQFAVHSWIDHRGREPDDFAPDAPENRLYLDYYVEMGMTQDAARQFYAMTNSVPHAGAMWLRADEMGRWLQPPEPAFKPVRIAKLQFITAALSLSRAPVRGVAVQQIGETGTRRPFPLAMLSDTALRTVRLAQDMMHDVS